MSLASDFVSSMVKKQQEPDYPLQPEFNTGSLNDPVACVDMAGSLVIRGHYFTSSQALDFAKWITDTFSDPVKVEAAPADPAVLADAPPA